MWLKECVKKFPGIRRVVEGRDRYISLYETQLKDTALCNTKLAEIQAMYSALQNEYEVLEQRCIEQQADLDQQGSMISSLQLERERTAEELDTLKGQLKQLQTQIEDAQKENAQLKAQLQRFHYRESSESLSSGSFWNDYYAQGGNSGSGSYGRLAEFKRHIIEQFLRSNSIHTVVEIGCGDGNQLSLIDYEDYTGVDVSQVIINVNRERFQTDAHKHFYCTLTERDKYIGKKYDLALSMDVIFHLLEDDVFHAYLEDLFSLSNRFVIVYSSNHEEYTPWPEYRHRNFTGYVQEHFPEWKLIHYIPNLYPYRIGEEDDTSASDFYIYKK